jgi:hypothetical protein
MRHQIVTVDSLAREIVAQRHWFHYCRASKAMLDKIQRVIYGGSLQHGDPNKNKHDKQ